VKPLSRLVEDQPQWAYPETDGLAPHCADRRCDDCRAGDCCCTCHLPDWPADRDYFYEEDDA
jgi:hypothetical protein